MEIEHVQRMEKDYLYTKRIEGITGDLRKLIGKEKEGLSEIIQINTADDLKFRNRMDIELLATNDRVTQLNRDLKNTN